jgi:hypothetical protein
LSISACWISLYRSGVGANCRYVEAATAGFFVDFPFFEETVFFEEPVLDPATTVLGAALVEAAGGFFVAGFVVVFDWGSAAEPASIVRKNSAKPYFMFNKKGRHYRSKPPLVYST